MASSSFFSILNHQDISPNHFADILRTWDVNTQVLPQFVSEINLKLHKTGDERVKGIFLLEWFLLHANPSMLIDEAVGWMLQCLRNDGNSGADSRELKILHELLHKSKDFPDVKRTVGNTVLPKFAEMLSKKDEAKNVKLWKLKCLKFFQISYSGPCGLHRNPIQKFIISILGNSCEEDSPLHSAAADCFALSSQCGSRGKLGVTVMKDSWSNEYERIMNTIWFTALQLFDGINLIWKPNKNYEDDDLISFSDAVDVLTLSPIERYYYLKGRFVVLLKMLESMMLVKFPVSKCFEALAVLDIVQVVCNISGNQISAEIKTTDAIIINAFMPDLYVAVMDLLAALIRCGGRNLLSNSIAICRLCSGILKTTGLANNNWAYGDTKPFQRVRVHAYNTLSQWLTVAKTCSSIEVFGAEIFFYILEDIHFEKPAVALVAKKNKNPQKKPLPENCSSKMTNGNEVIDVKANNLVCKHALMAFQLIISNTSMFLKPEYYKTVQDVVVSTLLEIQSCNDISEYPIPYSDNACRLQLYRSLLPLVTELLCSHSEVLASISIFNAAIRDSDPKIVQFASKALTQMEPIIHPRGPGLGLQCESDRDARIESRVGDGFAELLTSEDAEKGVAKLKMKNEKNERTILPSANQSRDGNQSSEKDSTDTVATENCDEEPFDIYQKWPLDKDGYVIRDASNISLDSIDEAAPASNRLSSDGIRGLSSLEELMSRIRHGEVRTFMNDFVPTIRPNADQ